MKMKIYSINIAKISVVICTCFFVFSCKTVSIHQNQQKLTEYPVTLGSIGEDKNFVIQKDYKTTAYPDYKKPIKVEAQVIPFNKATFSAFKKANAFQASTLDIKYTDSLKAKPKFLNIKLSDRIAVLNTIKRSSNQSVENYIRTKEDAHIVTSVSIALKTNDILDIQKVDEVFLSASGLKNYVLKLYTNKKVVKSISFNDGVIFSYKTSNFCWKQDDKYKVQIIDIVESNSSCPKKSYRSAKRADKKVNYYKF